MNAGGADVTMVEEIQPTAEEIQPTTEEIQPPAEEIQPMTGRKSRKKIKPIDDSGESTTAASP